MLLRSVSSLRNIGREIIEKESLKYAHTTTVLQSKFTQLSEALFRCETELKEAISNNKEEDVGRLTLERDIIKREWTATQTLVNNSKQSDKLQRFYRYAKDHPSIISYGAYIWA